MNRYLQERVCCCDDDGRHFDDHGDCSLYSMVALAYKSWTQSGWQNNTRVGGRVNDDPTSYYLRRDVKAPYLFCSLVSFHFVFNLKNALCWPICTLYTHKTMLTFLKHVSVDRETSFLSKLFQTNQPPFFHVSYAIKINSIT